MNTRLTTGCKALLLGGLICLSTWALALPSPKDIQASVDAGQFAQAETQLREVLREKPNSARAHYELAQVLAREGRYIEAQVALRQAQKLEPSLKFAASPDQFNALMRKLEAQTHMPASSLDASGAVSPAPGAATTPAAPAQPQVTPPGHRCTASGPSGTPRTVGGQFHALGLAAARRRRDRRRGDVDAPRRQRPAHPGAAPPLEPQGFGRDYTPAPAYPNYPNYPNYPGYSGSPSAASNGMGSMVRGAVIGGLAGAAAGYALGKVLEDDHPTASPSATSGAGSPPLDALPDRPDLGNFDVGTGNGWDNADAGGGGDDNNW